MHGAPTAACLAGAAIGLMAVTSSLAATDAGPYQGIVERNVFGLKPPPAPQPDTPPPPPPQKITLTGITTILGNKRALLSVAIPNKQPETHILTEGQRQGEIEVLAIDERAGVVTVMNHGVEQQLDFKTDGAKAQPPPVIPGMIPPPNQPGMPPRPTNPAPTPLPQIQQQGAARQPQQGLPARTLPMPTRSVRIPNPPGAPASGENVPPIPQQ